MRVFSFKKSFILNALWVPLQFQDTALITIAVPAALLRLAPADHVRVLAAIAAMVAFVSMIVPPVSGAISDSMRRRGVARRIPILAGVAIDAACLIVAAQAHTLGGFITFLLLATMGANITLSAYQALIPDIVPQSEWGKVSGVRSVTFLLGTVVGIGVAAGTTPQSTLIGIAIAMLLGAFTVFGITERPADRREDRAHISDWHDFTVVFVSSRVFGVWPGAAHDVRPVFLQRHTSRAQRACRNGVRGARLARRRDHLGHRAGNRLRSRAAQISSSRSAVFP